MTGILQDYLELIAENANDGDVGAKAYALRSLIRTEAAPYVDVDWLRKFPMVTDHVKSQVLSYTSALCHAQSEALELCLAGALVGRQVPDVYDCAAIELGDLRTAGAISRDEYYWHLDKLKADQSEVARGRGQRRDVIGAQSPFQLGAFCCLRGCC